MASKALNQMIFDADWGELDFMLIDLPPGTGDIHLSIVQSLPITGAVVVSTPQAVALADAKKGVSMFLSEAINVPVLGIIALILATWTTNAVNAFSGGLALINVFDIPKEKEKVAVGAAGAIAHHVQGAKAVYGAENLNIGQDVRCRRRCGEGQGRGR